MVLDITPTGWTRSFCGKRQRPTTVHDHQDQLRPVATNLVVNVEADTSTNLLLAAGDVNRNRLRSLRARCRPTAVVRI